MKLPDRTVAEFLATPLTPMALMYLHTELSVAFARIRRMFMAGYVLYLIAGLAWLSQLPVESGLLLPIAVILLGVPVAVFELVRHASLKSIHRTDYVGAAAILGGCFPAVGLLMLLPKDLPGAQVLTPLLALALLSGLVEFAVRLGVDTALARWRLDPVEPEAYMGVLEQAQRHPEIERFRLSLVAEGRQFMTRWEHAAVLRYEADREITDQKSRSQAAQQRFFAASTA